MTLAFKNFGYFIHRDSNSIGIMREGGKIEQFEILSWNEFDTDRQCSSIVVKNADGKIFAYVKGSDTSIMSKLVNELGSKDQLQQDIDSFARKGLRTLVFAYKEISPGNKIDFNNFYDDVTIDEIESDLKLLGATGVKDLLQDNVSRCIQDFKAAGIKVWMLTGDKGETATQIAR